MTGDADADREWREPRPSKARKAMHALARGALVAVGFLAIGLALRAGLIVPLTGGDVTGDLLGALPWTLLAGALVAGKWYWEATGGDPL